MDAPLDPHAARAGIERAIDRLHQTTADIRHYIFDLRAADKGRDDQLPVMLQQLLDGFPHPDVEFVLEVTDPPAGTELPKRVQWECWHIAREAVANALRHSGCRRVSIILQVRARELELRIVDDGAGFDPSTPAGEGHRGLRNMERRAATLGGRVRVDSAPGQGTTTTLRVPLTVEGGAK